MSDPKEQIAKQVGNYVEGFFGEYVQKLVEGGGKMRAGKGADDGGAEAGSEGEMGREDKGNTGGKRVRTDDLRQQNARAQQRYRERQKNWQKELQTKVEDLQRKLREMDEELAGKAALEGKVEVLEQKISIREYEISVLRQEVASTKGGLNAAAGDTNSIPLSMGTQMTGLAGLHGGVSQGLQLGLGTQSLQVSGSDAAKATNGTTAELGAAAAYSKIQAAHDSSSGNTARSNISRILSDQSAIVQAQVQNAEVKQKEHILTIVDELQQKWLTQLTKLAETGIASISGKQCSESELKDLVNETCELCLHMRMTQDPSVGPLLKAKIEDHTNMTPEQFNHWLNVARRLHLQPIQMATLMQMRQATLKLLSEVYARREVLNDELSQLCSQGQLAAMSVQEPTNSESSSTNLKAKLIPWAANAGRKGLVVFDNLKANLKEEQMILVEINMDFIHKVLTPSQSIRFMVDSYPDHAHALPLANAMALARREGEIYDLGGGVNGAEPISTMSSGTANAHQQVRLALGSQETAMPTDTVNL